MALASRRAAVQFGHAKPRLAPPVPARSGWKEFHALAAELGIDLFPWQDTAARYITALGVDDRLLYREVAIVVARQNGKTTLLIPLVVQRLLAGQRVMHTAQNAKLPREIHDQVATLLTEKYPHMLPRRRAISYALGHEEINLTNGGQYRIVAPTKGGARGPSTDLVIVDELREMTDHGFIAAAKPTLTASPRPQMLYLSNAGTEESEVLNTIKKRSAEDPTLAYLEWSAASGRKPDQLAGWIEANPALGHMPGVLDTLTTEYRTAILGGTMAIFETEHLCRWVVTMRPPLFHPQAWADCEGEVGKPSRPSMAVSMAPDGRRASAVLAWPVGEDKIALQVLVEATGDPIDPVKFGTDMRYRALRLGAKVGFDPITDAELAKFFTKPESITGRSFANASALFVTTVEGKRLVWQDADAVTEDLVWTARKANDDTQTFEAVRSDDDRPITAVLAAIRAVWLASGPRPTAPRVY